MEYDNREWLQAIRSAIRKDNEQEDHTLALVKSRGGTCSPDFFSSCDVVSFAIIKDEGQRRLVHVEDVRRQISSMLTLSDEFFVDSALESRSCPRVRFGVWVRVRKAILCHLWNQANQ